MTHPPEVGCSFGVRSLFDEFVDAIEVIGHRLAVLDLHHLDDLFFPLLPFSTKKSAKNDHKNRAVKEILLKYNQTWADDHLTAKTAVLGSHFSRF
jgi:hypothetical protein